MSGVGDEYLRAKVMTASPYRLHLMVIDEMLKHSRKALNAIDARDFETSHGETARAREYCAEVLSGIRDDASPELAANVKDYFLHVQKYLFMADMQQDKKSAEKAIELLEGYRESWVELNNHLAAAV
ncbi:MAG: flagellar protein FliS [Planctomycetaceae bacterium]|jgi:flagellar biosynthetic protein FliS|nr:flagellar protein FliS [Planctomycetaceae bacterium]MDA1159864.1 flagellar protein FliS [Planctomycetota bacterium]